MIKGLGIFREKSPDWKGILESFKSSVGAGLRPASLRSAIRTYFQLS